MKTYLQLPYRKVGLLVLLLFTWVLTIGRAQAANNITTTLVNAPDIEVPSLILDTQGNPVVAYSETSVQIKNKLRLLRCNDPNCDGGGEVFSSPYPGPVKSNIELVLDKFDNPVIAYRVPTVSEPRIMVIHCNDAYCKGNDEAYNYFDLNDNHGSSLSLALDAKGYPVISYIDDENQHLKLVHCNDLNCSGYDENIHFVDVGGSVGFNSSLALDKQGYPVISYLDETNGDLKVAHCNDPNCEGGDESITNLGIVSFYQSYADWPLELDSKGYPVITYFSDEGVNLLHCNDPNCVGGDESITSQFYWFSSEGRGVDLVLDSDGHPVIAVGDFTTFGRLWHCNDPNCEGDDESENLFGHPGDGGEPTIALDKKGYPVIVSVEDNGWNKSLMLQHCINRDCTPNQLPDCTKAVPSMEFLWPLDHGFKPIDILQVSDPDGDEVTSEITGIFQDEPVTSPGDPTHPDGQGVGSSTAQVRAEFSNPNGRVYTINYRAEDGYGGLCTGAVKVHALGFDIYAIEDQQKFDSTESP